MDKLDALVEFALAANSTNSTSYTDNDSSCTTTPNNNNIVTFSNEGFYNFSLSTAAPVEKKRKNKQLKLHMERHTREKVDEGGKRSYCCMICERPFSTKGSAERHIQTQHSLLIEKEMNSLVIVKPAPMLNNNKANRKRCDHINCGQWITSSNFAAHIKLDHHNGAPLEKKQCGRCKLNVDIQSKKCMEAEFN